MSKNHAFPPTDSCDCHVHVIGPKSQFPLALCRSYTPMDATVSDLLTGMDRMGLERAVVVQPSVYGTDNRCMLDAVAHMEGRGRAVAVVANDITGSKLDALHKGGVRGLRLNLMSGGTPDAGTSARVIADTARICSRNGWHIQLFAPSKHLRELSGTLNALPVDVVFDHFALVRPENPDEAAVETVTALLGEGRAWIKLSGTYRVAEGAFDPRLGALARRFVEANPERVVWASDWPHTPAHNASTKAGDREQPYRDIDTRALLTSLAEWFGPEDQITQILVYNPARLYDFVTD